MLEKLRKSIQFSKIEAFSFSSGCCGRGGGRYGAVPVAGEAARAAVGGAGVRALHEAPAVLVVSPVVAGRDGVADGAALLPVGDVVELADVVAVKVEANLGAGVLGQGRRGQCQGDQEELH